MMHYSFGDGLFNDGVYPNPDATYMQSVWMIPDIIDAM